MKHSDVLLIQILEGETMVSILIGKVIAEISRSYKQIIVQASRDDLKQTITFFIKCRNQGFDKSFKFEEVYKQKEPLDDVINILKDDIKKIGGV